MGHEPLTKYVVLFVTLVQLSTAWYLRSTPFFSLKFWALAYLVGGTANQNTFLAVHEITHNLAFRGVRQNRLFAIFANLPIGVPFAMMFKKYHIEHHKVSSHRLSLVLLGCSATAGRGGSLRPSGASPRRLLERSSRAAPSRCSTDASHDLCAVPRRRRHRHGPALAPRAPRPQLRPRQGLLRVRLSPFLSSRSSRRAPPDEPPSLTRLSSFQIFFYALRPGFIRYQAPTRWVALNWLVQLSFNALVVKVAGWHSMLYFLLSSHLAGSLHPCAGHFVRRRSDLVLLLESGGRRDSGTS